VIDKLRSELINRPKHELIGITEKLGLKGLSGKKKAELIDAILAVEPKLLRRHFYTNWWQRHFYAIASWASIIALILGRSRQSLTSSWAEAKRPCYW
jgi:hypothetical protein